MKTEVSPIQQLKRAVVQLTTGYAREVSTRLSLEREVKQLQQAVLMTLATDPALPSLADRRAMAREIQKAGRCAHGGNDG